jgi:Carboxypeptidase regulatory-like domain
MELGRRKSWYRWLRLGFALVVWCVSAAVGLAQSDSGQSSSQSQSADAEKSSNSSNPGKKDKSNEPPTTRLRIEITDPKGKPVDNASVYVRFNQSGGILHKDKLAELNLKTNGDGTVKVPDIPQGKILIQVIAKGLHTYGKWYDIEKDQETVQIKLEPPPHWY